MLYGILKGGDVIVVADETQGRQVVEAAKPEAPAGYEAKASFVDGGTTINQVWSLVPIQGTGIEAAVALAKIQAATLPDADAIKVAALYEEWTPYLLDGNGDYVLDSDGEKVPMEYYGPDDPDGNPQSRVRFQGTLVKCLQTHTSQPDWAPNAAPSLWALILAGQDGSGVEVGVWVQPGADNGYAYGDRVIHNGHLWESDYDPEGELGGNVWEPGQVGSHWVDKGEWDAPAAA